MTAGSVDDGKSTLIGRLLLDAGVLMRDQVDWLGDDAEALAALTDGLEAERAQGITIDVAYRYFATPERELSSSPMRRGTSNTRATWSPRPAIRTSR